MKSVSHILSFVALFLSVATGVSAQQTLTIPYYCSFEDPVENAKWTLVNPSPSGQKDEVFDAWYVGQATSSDGVNSLFVSSNGGVDAEYDSVPGIVYATRRFTLPSGSFDISFDWRNMAGENSGLYFAVYSPTSFTPVAQLGNPAIPSALKNNFKPVELYDGSTVRCMSGSTDWVTVSYPITSNGTREMEIAFVWVNSTRKHTDNPIAACIDNIQIVSNACMKPANLTMSATCDTTYLSWEGYSTDYIIEYKYSDRMDWYVMGTSHTNSYKHFGLDEGVYDFRVRSMCVNAEDGDTSYSAYACKSLQLVYCPDNHCIPLYPLDNDDRITCAVGGLNMTTGEAGGWLDTVVDLGSDEKYSRHTVNLRRGQFDRRSKGRLKTIPDDELLTIRLGNWNIGAESERIDFKYYVNPSESNILLLRYALIFEDPSGHPDNMKPRFTLTIMDKDGFIENMDCDFIDFEANKNDKKWVNLGESENSSYILMKDWTTEGVDLSRFSGDTIIIRIQTADCGHTGHYGYGYFTLDCTPRELETVSCGAEETVPIKAPDGFDYAWYASSDPNIMPDTEADIPISAEQVYNVTASDDITYFCRCMSKELGEYCDFFVNTVVSPRKPFSSFEWTQTPQKCENIVTLKSTSHILSKDEFGNDLHLYDKSVDEVEWILNGKEKRMGSQLNYTVPPEGGQLRVQLMSYLYDLEGNRQCDAVLDTIIDVPSITTEPQTIDTTICFGSVFQFDERNFATSVYGITNERNHTNWAGCDSIVTLNLTVQPKIEDTEIDTVLCAGEVLQVGDEEVNETCTRRRIKLTASTGCDSVVIVTAKVYPPISFTVSTVKESDIPYSGAVKIENLTGVDPDNYTYSLNGEKGVPLDSLRGGLYKVVVYNEAGCPSDTVEALVESDCLEFNANSTSPEACADDSIISIAYTIDAGFITDYSLLFDAAAKSVGFEDHIKRQPVVDGRIDVMIPDSLIPNRYNATLKLNDVICGEQSMPIVFNLLYPESVIRQKWNDVLSLTNSRYNGGYDFTSYQWYCNDAAIPGATASYYYLQDGVMLDTSAVYHAVVGRSSDGVVLATCKVSPELSVESSSYPTVTYNVSNSKACISQLESDATLLVFNASGQLIASYQVDAMNLQIPMPQVSGVYILHLVAPDDTSIHKVIVP